MGHQVLGSCPYDQDSTTLLLGSDVYQVLNKQEAPAEWFRPKDDALKWKHFARNLVQGPQEQLHALVIRDSIAYIGPGFDPRPTKASHPATTTTTASDTDTTAASNLSKLKGQSRQVVEGYLQQLEQQQQQEQQQEQPQEHLQQERGRSAHPSRRLTAGTAGLGLQHGAVSKPQRNGSTSRSSSRSNSRSRTPTGRAHSVLRPIGNLAPTRMGPAAAAAMAAAPGAGAGAGSAAAAAAGAGVLHGSRQGYGHWSGPASPSAAPPVQLPPRSPYPTCCQGLAPGFESAQLPAGPFAPTSPAQHAAGLRLLPQPQQQQGPGGNSSMAGLGSAAHALSLSLPSVAPAAAAMQQLHRLQRGSSHDTVSQLPDSLGGIQPHSPAMGYVFSPLTGAAANQAHTAPAATAAGHAISTSSAAPPATQQHHQHHSAAAGLQPPQHSNMCEPQQQQQQQQAGLLFGQQQQQQQAGLLFVQQQQQQQAGLLFGQQQQQQQQQAGLLFGQQQQQQQQGALAGSASAMQQQQQQQQWPLTGQHLQSAHTPAAQQRSCARDTMPPAHGPLPPVQYGLLPSAAAAGPHGTLLPGGLQHSTGQLGYGYTAAAYSQEGREEHNPYHAEQQQLQQQYQQQHQQQQWPQQQPPGTAEELQWGGDVSLMSNTPLEQWMAGSGMPELHSLSLTRDRAADAQQQQQQQQQGGMQQRGISSASGRQGQQPLWSPHASTGLGAAAASAAGGPLRMLDPSDQPPGWMGGAPAGRSAGSARLLQSSAPTPPCPVAAAGALVPHAGQQQGYLTAALPMTPRPRRLWSQAEQHRLWLAAAVLAAKEYWVAGNAAAIEASSSAGGQGSTPLLEETVQQLLQQVPDGFRGLYSNLNQDEALWNAVLHWGQRWWEQQQHSQQQRSQQQWQSQQHLSHPLLLLVDACLNVPSRSQDRQRQASVGQGITLLLEAAAADEQQRRHSSHSSLGGLQGGPEYLGGAELPINPSRAGAQGASVLQPQEAAAASRVPLGQQQGSVDSEADRQAAQELQRAADAAHNPFGDARAAVVDSAVCGAVLEGVRHEQQKAAADARAAELSGVIQSHSRASGLPESEAAAQVLLAMAAGGRRLPALSGAPPAVLWLAADMMQLEPAFLGQLQQQQQQEQGSSPAVALVYSLSSLTSSNRQAREVQELLVGLTCTGQLGSGASGSTLRCDVSCLQLLNDPAAASSSGGGGGSSSGGGGSSSGNLSTFFSGLREGMSVAAKVVMCKQPSNLAVVLGHVAHEAEVHRRLQQALQGLQVRHSVMRCYGWGAITHAGVTHGVLLLELAAANATALLRFPRQLQPAPLTFTYMCLSPAAVHSIVRQVAAQLYMMHSLFMFHGDVKAANVLLMGDIFSGLVMLSDFGWSKIMRHGGDFQRGPSGTRSHAAPEQQGGWRQDCSVDTFCLVLLMLELASGGLPYQLIQLVCAGDVQQMRDWLFSPSSPYRDPSSPAVLPPDALAFVDWGLKLPDERPTLYEAWNPSSSLCSPYLMSTKFPPSEDNYQDP